MPSVSKDDPCLRNLPAIEDAHFLFIVLFQENEKEDNARLTVYRLAVPWQESSVNRMLSGKFS